jgi:hypothetical protein
MDLRMTAAYRSQAHFPEPDPLQSNSLEGKRVGQRKGAAVL